LSDDLRGATDEVVGGRRGCCGLGEVRGDPSHVTARIDGEEFFDPELVAAAEVAVKTGVGYFSDPGLIPTEVAVKTGVGYVAGLEEFGEDPSAAQRKLDADEGDEFFGP
jgi:hypothetical protein